jgi:hypothetical protein
MRLPVPGLRAADVAYGRGQFHRAVTADVRTYGEQARSLIGQMTG